MKTSKIIFSMFVYALIAITVCTILFFDLFSDPSFIEEIKNNVILPTDIKQISIIRFKLTDSWPFTQEEYEQKERVNIMEKSNIDELYKTLKLFSQKGFKPANHPLPKYRGIFQIITNKNEKYYILYTLYSSRAGPFVEINANVSGETNPNAGTVYWNVRLFEYLKSHDPWYMER